MKRFIPNFLKNEDGAVTVEWVVLTAAIVGLTVSAYMAIDGAAAEDGLAGNTDTALNGIVVGSGDIH